MKNNKSISAALAHKIARTKRLKSRIHHKKRFLIFLQFFSSVVEYYDFFTFAFIFFYLIGMFNHQTVEVYGITIISLVSFLFRPLGYRLQIWLSRIYSRRTIIMINGLMMTLSVITPGIIMNIETSPWLTCSIILISRILNGISFGIKLQSNVTYIKCSFPKRLHYAIANSTLGAQFGLTLSIFITHWLAQHLTSSELIWGWRLPFFFGGFLSLILFIMRIATYSRLRALTDITISLPLDKIAFKSGATLWLGLLISSAKACLTFTIFISIPSILGWTLKLSMTYITQTMFIVTLLNTLVSSICKYYLRMPKAAAINSALGTTLILTAILSYALFNGNYHDISLSLCGLAILNGYLVIAIPIIIEKILPSEFKFESMLFISNYEYFHFNVIRRLGMLGIIVFIGNNISKIYFLGNLLVSIWIAIIPSIFAICILQLQNKKALVKPKKLT